MEKIPWFKFYTGFFKRQSVTLISNLRNSEAIIIVLIKLICMATETNDRGYVYITPERPYKLKEIAAYMSKSTKVMENILNILQEYGEIEIEKDGMIFVTSWSEEQNVDRLEILKANHRKRQSEYRKRKIIKDNDALRQRDVTCDITVTKSDAGEEEEYEYEKENEYEELNKDINDDVYDIISYLNNKLSTDYNPKDKLIIEMIKSKFSMGYKKEDFFKVIDNKINSWKGTSYEKYLQPSTLFGDKFGLYLNEKTEPQYDFIQSSTDYSSIKNIGIFD